jgi:hypothetical protein
MEAPALLHSGAGGTTPVVSDRGVGLSDLTVGWAQGRLAASLPGRRPGVSLQTGAARRTL